MGLREAFIVLMIATVVFTKSAKRNQQLCQIDIIREFVIEKIEEIMFNINQEDWQYMAKKKQGVDGELMIEFREISKAIDDLIKPIIPNSVMEAIWSLGIVKMEADNIDMYYSTFKKFQNKPDSLIYKDSWSEFASTCINNSNNKHSVLKSLEIVQDMIYDNEEGHKNIFQLANEEANNSALKCEKDQSIQQMVYNMYGVLQLTQLKAYTLVQFSWMLLKIYEKGNFSLESELFRQKFMERMQQQADIVIKEMKLAPNDILKCDPIFHVKDETYTDITRFLQGYVVNEVDLNGHNTCKEDCSFYKYTKQHGCFKDQFCSRQPTCRGNIVGCNFVDSDMWICQAPATSMRRYDWIEYENGRNLGYKKSCSRAVTKVDSWWRWLFWHCSYCFCFCDDPTDHKSHRYFNMRAATSDLEKNKVVVGLRFIKMNKVIHLQILEGELLKHGQINGSTVTWRPVDDYNVMDNSVTAGVDYHMLTWEHRAIDLDDLIAPENHLLTGIRFRRVGGHLNLEIRITEVDFSNGVLKDHGEKSMWISNDNTDGAYDKPRTKVHLQNPDDPVRKSEITTPDSKSDQFIEFTSSDLDLDGGQTAVPFIDTQVVAPQPPTPLIGAGIYHKGKKYSGGFIAPKVFTYDYSENIRYFFPEVNEAEF